MRTLSGEHEVNPVTKINVNEDNRNSSLDRYAEGKDADGQLPEGAKDTPLEDPLNRSIKRSFII